MESCSVTTVRWRRLDGKNRSNIYVPFGTICSLLCGIDGKKRMDKPDRRVRRTRESLHKALISLALEKHYDSITVQEVLDRADVGRSTFYTHFQSMDELLISGTQELRRTLHAALENHRKSAKRHESVIAFSPAMFDHAYGSQCLLRSLEYRGMADCSAAITGCSGRIDTTRMQGRNCEAEDGEFGRSR